MLLSYTHRFTIGLSPEDDEDDEDGSDFGC